MKHFQKAHVWGVVDEIELPDNGTTRRVEIKLICPSEKYGDVIAYCRLFGTAVVESVEADIASGRLARHASVKLEGVASQYKGRRGKLYTNYVGFRYRILDEKPEKGYRAAVIMVGQIMELEQVGAGGRAVIEMRRDGNATRLEIRVRDWSLLNGIGQGAQIRAKCLIEQETPEDEYGDRHGDFHLYAGFIEVLEHGDAPF